MLRLAAQVYRIDKSHYPQSSLQNRISEGILV